LFFNIELIILRGKTLNKTIVITKLKGKTSYLITITKFILKANIII
jgi:hypothetical protein